MNTPTDRIKLLPCAYCGDGRKCCGNFNTLVDPPECRECPERKYYMNKRADRTAAQQMPNIEGVREMNDMLTKGAIERHRAELVNLRDNLGERANPNDFRIALCDLALLGLSDYPADSELQRRWSLARDGFGVVRDDENGAYVYYTDAIAAIAAHLSANPQEDARKMALEEAMVAFTAEQRKVLEELQAGVEASLGVKVSASQAITIAASAYIRNARLLIRGLK